MVKSYKDLIVWQKSFDLVKKIYKAVKHFPTSELYGLSSQIKRSAVSIPSNIAEGCARGGRKEFHHFALIAFGSGAELETQLLLAKELDFIDDKELDMLESQLSEVMKMLNSLISKLN